jgi:triphosphatase
VDQFPNQRTTCAMLMDINAHSVRDSVELAVHRRRVVPLHSINSPATSVAPALLHQRLYARDMRQRYSGAKFSNFSSWQDIGSRDSAPMGRRGRRQRPLSTEVELKLVAPAAELEPLERAILAMPTVRSEARSDLVSTYYDTSTRALHGSRLTLRVRTVGEKVLQTVKTGDLMEANLWERREWEDRIASRRPDLDAPKTRARLPDVIRKEDLRPVFTTVVTRRVIELEPHPSTRIEVAVDWGEIRTADGNAVEPISEIELELKRGDPAALHDSALRLLQVAKIRLEMRSKAERGYRLLGTAAAPRPVQAKPVALDPTMTVEAALQCFGQRCIDHLLHNEVVALAGDSEAIHQMRVAVRRLRSALSTLKSVLPAEQCRWASEELKWLTHALGPARNWDIFVGDLVRPVSDALPDRRELEQLVSAAGQLRPGSVRRCQASDPLRATHRIDVAAHAMVCGSRLA